MGRKKKTESLTSPQGGNRGCLCEDGTYSLNCCDGTLQAQVYNNTLYQTLQTRIQNVQ